MPELLTGPRAFAGDVEAWAAVIVVAVGADGCANVIALVLEQPVHDDAW